METKDIQYFLDAENEFQKQHPDYGTMYFDEEYGMGEVGQDDRAEFLMHKPFADTLTHVKSIIKNKEVYGLTLTERVLLCMYYGQYSSKFRDDYYYDKKNMPEVIHAMFDGLNNLIEKAPQNRDTTLYRFCNDYDSKNMKVGEVVTFAYNLTCTNFDWKQEDRKDVYVITPLGNGMTKAHNLFEIYEHGDEKQVDFLRGTSFKVTKIEETKGTKFKTYYLAELEMVLSKDKESKLCQLNQQIIASEFSINVENGENIY